MGKMYSGNLDIDFQNDIVDIAKHDGSAKGLKLGGTLVTATGAEMNQRALTLELDDISTAGQMYVVSPYAGTVTTIYSVLNGAIATSDATLTPKINGTAITDGAITVATASSAAGDVDSSTPSAANTVAAGDVIEIETDGASTNTVKVGITILITL